MVSRAVENRDVFGIIQLTPRSQLAPNTILSTQIHKGSPAEGVLKSLLIVQCFKLHALRNKF